MTNTQTPLESPASHEIVQELRGIRASIDTVSNALQNRESTRLIPETLAVTSSDKEASEPAKKSSRFIAATGMGLLGLKLGALIGAKLGLLAGWIAGRKSPSPTPNSDIENTIMRHLYIKEATVGGVIGSVIGAVALGALGWVRGSRVKNPQDFIKHPMESASKLLMGDDDGQKTVAPQHNKIQNDKTDLSTSRQWQDYTSTQSSQIAAPTRGH